MKPKFEFNLSKAVVDLYAENYNAKHNKKISIKSGTRDKRKDLLKAHHLELVYDLLRLYRKRLYNNFYRMPDWSQIENYSDVYLNTNNSFLAKRLKRSPASIKRHREALKEAGLIKKEAFHGTYRNYDIYLDEQFLAVFDHENNDFKPQLYNAEIQLVKYRKGSNRAVYPDVSCKIHLIKKVIQAEVAVFYENDSLIAGNKKQDTKQGTPASITPPSSKKAAPGAAAADYWHEVNESEKKLQNMKTKAATALIDLYISLMLIGKTIFGGERYRAIQYVKETYFYMNHAQGINAAYNVYAERLSLVKKYSEIHEKYQAPMPFNYFQRNNHRNGFRATKQWLEKDKLWKSEAEQRKREQKRAKTKYDRRLTDEQRMDTVLKKCLEDTSVNNILKQDDYMMMYLRHLYDKYVLKRQQLKNNNNGLRQS